MHKQKSPNALCHPTEPNLALGKCRRCYFRDWRKSLSATTVRRKTGQRQAAACKPEHFDRPAYSHSLCRTCYNREKQQEWRERNPGKVQLQLLSKYNLTQNEYDLLFQQQNGVCALCKNPRRLVIDHSQHGVRGLLCRACNGALGCLEPYLSILPDYCQSVKKLLHRGI